jgi:PKD repeat protein
MDDMPRLAQTQAAALAPDDFTFLVLPDTQNYILYPENMPVLTSQLDWIAANRSAMSLAFVAGVGDIVDNHTSSAQWTRASTAMATLDDAAVPYAVVPGNHDYDLTTGAFTGYDEHFPVTRFSQASWNSATTLYGGYYGEDEFGTDPVDRQNMNNYSLFAAGGMEFLLLGLELNPPDDVLAWAQRVLDAHPDRRVILTTHSYVNVSGAFSTQMLRTDVAGNSGSAMWQKLVAPNCQIFLVVNGHFTSGLDGEAHRTDTNACGRPVHAALSDFQGRPNGGDGWLRYYTFSPSRDEITATTYSPWLNAFETDADSVFTLNYDMAGGDPEPQPHLAADAFERAVPSGWGTADAGGAWTVNSATKFSVGGGLGRVSANAGSTLNASLSQVSSTSTSLTSELNIDKLPDQLLTATVMPRVVGAAAYGARLRVSANGAVALHLMRDSVALAGGTVSGARLAPTTPLSVRAEVVGTNPTTLRARVWPSGSTEPATWQYSATDSTAALQTAGSVRLSTYLAASATNGPVVVGYDDVAATTVGTAPPPPPANKPPVASFTSSTSGLTVSVDSSASTDPDGQIVTRTWSFAGSPATGQTASHTFASAGQYPVTLTVTDDDGAAASTTQTVTVSAPPPPAGELATDRFERAVTSGWGSADVGGSWTVNSQSKTSVAGGFGRFAANAGSTLTATLSQVASPRTDAHVVTWVDKLANQYVNVSVAPRIVGASSYSARLRVNANGTVALQLVRDGTALAGGTVSGLTVGAGTKLHVRTQAAGTSPTTLRAKVWLDGTAEPSAWQVSASDTTAALQTSGAVGVVVYTGSGTTNGPISVAFDELHVAAVP